MPFEYSFSGRGHFLSDMQPSDESSSLSSEENAQLLHLVQDCSNNLRHAKAQQWLAAHLTILAYAALVASAYGVAAPDRPLMGAWPIILVAIGSVLTFVAFVIGVWIIWDLQSWASRLRKSLSNAEKHFSCRYRKIAGSLHGGNNYHSVFYRSLQTWLLTFVMAVGWLIAGVFIVMRFISR